MSKEGAALGSEQSLFLNFVFCCCVALGSLGVEGLALCVLRIYTMLYLLKKPSGIYELLWSEVRHSVLHCFCVLRVLASLWNAKEHKFER